MLGRGRIEAIWSTAGKSARSGHPRLLGRGRIEATRPPAAGPPGAWGHPRLLGRGRIEATGRFRGGSQRAPVIHGCSAVAALKLAELRRLLAVAGRHPRLLGRGRIEAAHWRDTADCSI